jgi:hypothetical protein
MFPPKPKGMTIVQAMQTKKPAFGKPAKRPPMQKPANRRPTGKKF